MNSTFRIAPLLIPFLLLAACGGGGDGGNNPPANTPPIADAGDARTVEAGAGVTLDGSASSDPDGHPDGNTLTYAWTQVSGPPVALSDSTAAKPAFTAPSLAVDTLLHFSLEVTDAGNAKATDTVTITVNRAADFAIELPETLGIREPLVIDFGRSMRPDAFMVTGSLARMSEASWSSLNVENDTLTLTPHHGAWESGMNDVRGFALGIDGEAVFVEQPVAVPLVFQNGHAATVLIGTGAAHGNPSDNFGNIHLGRPAYDTQTGILFLPDPGVHRLVALENLPDASFPVFDFDSGIYGDNDTGIDTLPGASAATVHGDKLVVTNRDSNRIAIFYPTPQYDGIPLGVVVGQSSPDTNDAACTQAGLNMPQSHWVTPKGQLIVADTDNHRVMIWDQLPEEDGARADLVLGQENFESCAANRGGDASAFTLFRPESAWSDGERLVIADTENSRVLIWNTFPEDSNTPPNIVLGQGDFTHVTGNDADQNGMEDETPSAMTFFWPSDAWSNGLQLFVADILNNRVLVWNTFPTESFAPADAVIGQVDFTTTETRQDADDLLLLANPRGVFAVRDRLIIGTVTTGSAQYMIFPSN